MVNKITAPPTSGEVIDKINEVIDAIPTVNNATLTIQKNGSNVATFTANASSNVTANISVPVVEEYTAAEVDTLWNSISASS